MTTPRYLAYLLLHPDYERLGGDTGYAQIPEEVRAKFATHPGRKIIVYHDYWQADLYDVRGGYRVYDKNFVYRYSVAMSSNPEHAALYATDGLDALIPTFRYGVDPLDQGFAHTILPGDYFYLMYEHKVFTGANGRMLVRPTVDIVLAAPCSVMDTLAEG